MDLTRENWIELLKKRSESTPDRIIFMEYGKSSITYSEFYKKVLNTAAFLKSRFSDEEFLRPFFVSVDRDIPSLVLMLGVYAAGGWYVPVDNLLPPERASLFVKLADPIAVLLSNEHDPFADAEINKINFSEIGDIPYFPIASRDSASSMFGIFTSCSTGMPKLVVKNDTGISDFIREYCTVFGFNENEIFANQIPFYFDASTKDIFSTVLLGATTVIFPQTVFSFPLKLIEALSETSVTTFVCVPSVLVIAAKFNAFDEMVPEKLKNILFVGEKMPVNHLNSLMRALPHVTFTNLYGSTEVAGNSCYYRVKGEVPENTVLPIGTAFNTARVFLLDDDKKCKEEGEICVAGSGLAICYYGDREKTEAAFEHISIPEINFEGRIYHSGDFGRINENGELICISRKDAQIKHMGHRIELGDIETCALSLSYISECCCLFSKRFEKILLFSVCDEADKKRIRKDLTRQLPKYMLPHEYICLSSLPHNRNGKVDRMLLLSDWEIKEEKRINPATADIIAH